MHERHLSRGKRLDNGEWIYGSYASVSFWGSSVIVEQGFIVDRERKIMYVAKEPPVEIIGNIHDNPELLKLEG